jgi:hypothetical protein
MAVVFLLSHNTLGKVKHFAIYHLLLFWQECLLFEDILIHRKQWRVETITYRKEREEREIYCI